MATVKEFVQSEIEAARVRVEAAQKELADAEARASIFTAWFDHEVGAALSAINEFFGKAL